MRLIHDLSTYVTCLNEKGSLFLSGFYDCGYKTTFDIQTFAITPDSDQWMISSEILITEITNENDIHVKILH